MRAQVASLLEAAPPGMALLAAPPSVLSVIGGGVEEMFPLSETTGAGGLKGQVTMGWAVGAWARRAGATLLHGHGLRWLPLFAVAALRARMPLVLTLHNVVPTGKALGRAERLGLRLGLARAARIIAVSEAVAESVRAAVPGAARQRLTVIRNGIYLSRFPAPRDPARRSATRAFLGLTEKALIVVSVARLAPEKNLGVLLEAVTRLTGPFPELRILLVGGGPWRPTLERQVRLLRITDRVHFMGARPDEDIPDLLGASDLFCLPSQTEGLGIAAIEAMAAGLPVVASRVGGLPEVVKEGVTGLLVPPGDAPALSHALAAVLGDPALGAGMGEAGRARAHQDFDRRAMIAATFAVYEAVTASHSRPRKITHGA